MRSRRCILCQKTGTKAFFAFPKDVKMKKEWARICSLPDHVVVRPTPMHSGRTLAENKIFLFIFL